MKKININLDIDTNEICTKLVSQLDYIELIEFIKALDIERADVNFTADLIIKLNNELLEEDIKPEDLHKEVYNDLSESVHKLKYILD